MHRPLAVLGFVSILALSCTPSIAQSGTAQGQTTPVPQIAPVNPPQPPKPPTTRPRYKAPPPVVVDPKILRLLNSVQTKLRSVKSVSAEAHRVFTWSLTGRPNPSPIHQIIAIQLMRPNYAGVHDWNLQLSSVDGKWHKTKLSAIQIGDGRYYWFWLAYTNDYNRSASGSDGNQIPLASIDYFGGFFSNESSQIADIDYLNAEHALRSVTLKENQTWNGGKYKVVEITFDEMGSILQDCYIGTDGLIRRIFTHSALIGAKHAVNIVNEDETLDWIKLNPHLNKSSFKFTPPTGSHPD